MGGGRFDAGDWASYTTTRSYATKSTAEIFDRHDLDSDLDIKGKIRESRDSEDNPNSTPIILALDVTGSMSSVIDILARKSLPLLCTEIYNRKPVTDPHICIAGIGDAEVGDRVPFQASQFEADIRIAKHLEKLFLEGGGGGNSHEGYAQTWWFASTAVVADAIEKHGKKGYIFTIGDEQPQKILDKSDLEKVFGGVITENVNAEALLDSVCKNWEVFHLVVEEGDHARSRKDITYKEWRELLGQHVIPLTDVTKLAEVIVSVLEVTAGESADKVIDSWDGTTSVAVKNAVGAMTEAKVSEGLVTL